MISLASHGRKLRVSPGANTFAKREALDPWPPSWRGTPNALGVLEEAQKQRQRSWLSLLKISLA